MKKPIHYLITLIMLSWASILSAQDGVSIYVSPEWGCDSLYVYASNMSGFTHYSGLINYQWYVNGTPVSNNPGSFDTLLTQGGTYQITLDAFDSVWNPMGRDSRLVEVSSLSHFDIRPAPQVCPGEEVEVQFNFRGMIYNMQWNFGHGNTRTENYQRIAYDSLGIYPIQLYVETECGSNTIIQNLLVSDTVRPHIEIYTPGHVFCPGDPIRFETSYKDVPVTWHMSDGSVLQGSSVVHSFNHYGNYGVTATVTNRCGLSASVTDSFSIQPGLQARAEFDYYFENGENCPESPVHFNSHSTGYHQWHFGDGTTSNESYPVHYFTQPGTYPVRLIVSNSCGSSDTTVQQVTLEYRNWEYLGFEPYFRFDRDNSGSSYDTLFLCPGEPFNAFLEGGNTSDGYQYIWHLGNGSQLTGSEIHYAYTQPGLYEVSVSVTDRCHRSAYSRTRWVKVDPGLQPIVRLNYTPKELCPGEEVYFWDESWWDEQTLNVYNLIYGDGNQQNHITELSDHPLRVLAYHRYSNVGMYPFSFSATNLCGNSISLHDTIRVSTDPLKKPFYYVNNSTSNEESGSGGTGELPFWNMPVDSNSHEFIIPVQWFDWSPALNDTFYVYAWYGGFYPDGETGDPAGVAMYTSSRIASVDTFRIYVPVNPQAPAQVGFAVGWYCEPGKTGDEPDSWGTLMADTLPIHSLPLYAGGITHTADYTMGMPVQLSPWNGICRSSSVKGEWRGYTPNRVVSLSMYEDKGSYNYNLYIADDEQGNNNEFISGGQYSQRSENELVLYPNSGYCQDSARYAIQHINNGFLLTAVNDPCSQQGMYLDSVTFFPNQGDNSGNGNEPACPGDPVRFEIAGGTSYVWHFGDGATSTQKFPMHSYDSAGIYQAYVVATNSCGRTDTIFTPVRIADNIMPSASFYMEDWNIQVGDTAVFIPDVMHRSAAEFYTYQWQFGDGSSSNLMRGIHRYTQPGAYQVQLRVENGCGFNQQTITIHVQEMLNPCTVEARFEFEVHGDTLILHNYSRGDSLQVNWQFGDGNSSPAWNPVHIYTQPGVYRICLSVFDPIQECANNLCLEVVIGQLDCYADFSYVIDDYTNTVRFFNQSIHANHFYWQFGDGLQGYKANPVHVYPQSGWYRVSLDIRDTLTGCFNHREKEIWVGQLDTLTDCVLTWDYFTDSMTVNFNPEVTGTVSNGYWDFGDGSFGYEPQISHTYSAPGTYTVCAHIFDSLRGCQAERCEEITLGNLNCHANFAFIVDSVIAQVVFIDQSSSTFSEVYVEYGDGRFGVTVDTIHQYPGPGRYQVCMGFYNETTGCYREICKDVSIPGMVAEALCEASFTAIPVEGTLRVRFAENSLTEFNRWHWSFGDGGFDTLPNPIHAFPRPGVYRVCLSAFNSSTQCFDEVCRTISVAGVDLTAPLTASFEAIVNPITGNVKLINTSEGNFTTAYWILGDGSTGQSRDTLRHQYRPGMYRVCLMVANALNGQSNEYCKTITVGERPCLISADFSSFVNASTREVRLTDQSVGSPNRWFWTFGDGSSSTKRSPVKTYTRAGYYLITLAVRDTLSGCSDFTSELIQVGSTDCFANFEYSINPDTRAVSFLNTSNGNPGFFYWLFGDGASSSDENPVHTYTASGIYGIGLAINGNGGLCNSLTSKIIQIGDVNCNADFQVYVDSTSNRAYFDAEILGEATNLVWTFGDGGVANGTQVTHRYLAPGFYTVGLNTYNHTNGCMDFTRKTILIGQRGIDVEPEFFYRVNEALLTVDFIDNSLGEVAVYTWNFGDGNTSSEQNPSHTYSQAGYYNVCLTVETDGGIANTRCERIRVSNTGNECLSQFIYNVDSSNLEASFTDVSLGQPNGWNWNFNDGQHFTTQNPVVTFDSAGIYRVAMEISNSTTGCRSRSFGVINVAKGSTGLIAAFMYDVDTNAFKTNSYPVDLVAYPGESAANYLWDLDDGATFAGATEFTYNYSEPGIYNVCFTLSDPVTGASATDCQVVSTVTDTSTIEGLVNRIGLRDGLSVYPNPFTDYTKIVYSLRQTEVIELDVYDETGRHVSNLIRTQKESGIHELYWNAEALEPGVYIIQLKAAKSGLLQPICVVKH